jgi:formylglycine-generating enzyme
MIPTGKTYTNSLGIRFHRVEPGTFLMGNDRPLDDEIVRLSHWRHGDSLEHPVHRVDITQAYYVAETPLTNAQLEQIAPEHAALRGKRGFSSEDDEAAVFVSWHDAVEYCKRLAALDDMEYRLPTEVEWEYACRAGTNTAYWTGDTLPDVFHNNQESCWYPTVLDAANDHTVSMFVGRTPPNPNGLVDMHGLVEEWCSDWFAPYFPAPWKDITGPPNGDFKVTRGGSHSTELFYLRSTTRMGALPDERNWVIGFRPVIGPSPETWKALRGGRLEQCFHDVPSIPFTPERVQTASDRPYFEGPIPYVRIPKGTEGPPFGEHNHDSGFTTCPNGDLMAIWYSCVEEGGRELAICASRRCRDSKTGILADEWEETSVFWNTPNRNDHAPSLWSDGKCMYHFNGVSPQATYGSLAMTLRTSDDSGATWSDARILAPDHGFCQMPISGVFQMSDGTIILPCDAGPDKSIRGSVMWMSEDDGKTWSDTGGLVAGIHAGVVELADGSLYALGREADIDGRMACSISADRGKMWEYSASPFPGIKSSQRIVLMRVKGECDAGRDPILLVSFSNPDMDDPAAQQITDASGVTRPVSGMYVAASFDDGVTWPYSRPVSDDEPLRPIIGTDGYAAQMGPSHGEFKGYMSGTQSQDGMVHVITSWNQYSFNLAWLSSRAPGLS